MNATDRRQSRAEEVSQDQGAHLPHDRDQKAVPEADNAQRDENRTVVRQAHRDVENGLVDTERIGTPNDVPASAKARR